MSARGKLDKRDWISAARHAVIPLVADAGIEAISVIQTGEFSFDRMKAAFFSSVLAGGLRLVNRWGADIKAAVAKETL